MGAGQSRYSWHRALEGDSYTWEDVTGTKGHGGLQVGGASARDMNALAVISTPSGPTIALGGDDGLYLMRQELPGQWSKVKGDLPNAVVETLGYDAHDDVLLVGTLGRSTWELDNASGVNTPPVVVAIADGGSKSSVENRTFTSNGFALDGDSGDSEPFSGTADWGDHTPPTPLNFSGGNFDLSHRYADNGKYTLTVTVSDGRGGVGTDTATITIKDAAMTITGDDVSAAAGTSTGTRTVASFSDRGDDPVGGYAATIDWGDGTGTHTATVVRDSAGAFHVEAAHTFTNAGNFEATVQVTDNDGPQTVMVTDTVTVTRSLPS